MILLNQKRCIVLLWSIRPGKKTRSCFKTIDYVIKIISASYTLVNDTIVFNDDFKLIYEYGFSEHANLEKKLALSSLEYDKYHDRIYLLTSFEKDETIEGLGAYLWTLNIEDINSGKPPRLIQTDKHRPVRFNHKAEGIAVISDTTVFIIHDDDRVVGRPEPHQAVYGIVKFK